jgi:hypothetical protein
MARKAFALRGGVKRAALGANARMLFGHNTNVKVGDSVYHVQTEDRGTASAVIDTTVYGGGRVLHRRTNNYKDLLPLDAEREGVLRKRIDEQHGEVAEAIRSGVLKLASAAPVPVPAAKRQAEPQATTPLELSLELLNARTWLQGKQAGLQVSVRKKHNREAVPAALVKARVDGAADASEHTAKTGADGQARLDFEMPRLSGAEPVLVIEAAIANSKAQLRFQLRARPKVPAV